MSVEGWSLSSHDPNLCPESTEGIFSIWQYLRISRQVSPVSCCSIVETCSSYHPPLRCWELGSIIRIHSDDWVEACVLPILLYGVENWVLSSESIRMIDSFQGEIPKRILCLPKWYSNTAAIVALGWNSLHSICTIKKLRFLHIVMTNQESICHRAFSVMADDVESFSLVRECRELELRYNSTFTSAILCAKEQEKVNIIRNAQRNICKIDQSALLQKASTYPLIPNSDCQVCWMEKALG